MQARQKDLRRIVDIGMTVLLLFQMAYQVTGEAAHEWLGMGMTALVVVHQILNRRWYSAAFRGKYTLYRIASTGVNALLLVSFALTALCGMAMSNYAVPFLYGIARISAVRIMGVAWLASIPNLVVASALQGLSLPRPSMLITMLRQAVLPVLLALALSRLGRLNLIWLAFVLSEGIGIPVALSLWRRESGAVFMEASGG